MDKQNTLYIQNINILDICASCTVEIHLTEDIVVIELIDIGSTIKIDTSQKR